MPLELPSVRVLALLAVGGALGTVSRYLVGSSMTRSMTHSTFPWGTVVVNVSGSFLLALLLFAAIARGWFGPGIQLTVGAAFLGAYTTMSTFAYESLVLIDEGALAEVAGFFVLNPIACLAAAYFGRAIAYTLPEAGAI